MAAWAKPGVKCVCIKAFTSKRHRPSDVLPLIGQTYTIRDVTFSLLTGRLMLRFREMLNPDGPVREASFFALHFRPLVTQQDDVALFTHLLTPTSIKETSRETA